MIFSRRSALTILASPFLSSADEFWNTEPPENWTSEQIEQLTNKSPWAKPVTASIPANSPLSNDGANSGGGRRGRMSTTTGRNSGSNSGSGSPKFTGVVRWASAKPIRLALKLQFPPSLAEHIVISVSGLPIVSGHGGEDTSSDSHDSFDGLKQQTSLKVSGKEAVQPGIIEPDKSETSTLYFGFLAQMLELDGDKTVTFSTIMEPLHVKVKFETRQMKFKGEIAL